MGYSFKKLLSMSFNTVLEQYDDIIQADSARHIVNIKGSYMNDSFSDDSMVVVFYDINKRCKRLSTALTDPGAYVCSETKALIDDCWHADLSGIDLG